jgi:predicted short-subunit dehydrogenase-like oxidoreductase (DUF2520 family)
VHRLGIIGGGRAAWAYGSAWRRAGAPLAGVWLRPESSSRLPDLLAAQRATVELLAAEADLILVAVPDRVIEAVAAEIPPTGAIIFHASGALPHVRDGFSLHPLRVLPPVGAATDLRDALLVFEGNHRHTAEAIARDLGARFAEVSTAAKPLYHAGAVFGANYVAALLEIANDLIADAGVKEAREDLATLALSAVENWRAHGDARRFTGPAARGDAEVLRRHLQALEERTEVADLYRLLADQIASAILARPK